MSIKSKLTPLHLGEKGNPNIKDVRLPLRLGITKIGKDVRRELFENLGLFELLSPAGWVRGNPRHGRLVFNEETDFLDYLHPQILIATEISSTLLGKDYRLRGCIDDRIQLGEQVRQFQAQAYILGEGVEAMIENKNGLWGRIVFPMILCKSERAKELLEKHRPNIYSRMYG